jgi:hypothetical protein
MTASPKTELRAAQEIEVRAMGKVAKADQATIEDLVTRGLTPDQAGRELLTEMAKRDAEYPQTRGAYWPEGETLQDPEFACRAMGEALAARHGIAPATDAAREFTGMRLVDMARTLLEMRGVRARRMSASEILTRSYTTSDFPNLLLATGNRILRNAYESAESGLKRMARATTIADFRAKHNIQFSETPSLERVNEHSEVTHGVMTEADES